MERLTRNYTRPKDGEALYYLGVALEAQGKTAEARDWLQRAAWSHAWRAAAWQVLAEMACREGDWAEAMACIDQSPGLQCAQHQGPERQDRSCFAWKRRLDEALATASRTLQIDPLDGWARKERVLALVGSGHHDQARQERDRLGSLMQDAQTSLELACDYQACGLWDEAIDVLSRLRRRPGCGNRPDAPLRPGVLPRQEGPAERAREQHRLAGRSPTSGCFPFRMESAGMAPCRHRPQPRRQSGAGTTWATCSMTCSPKRPSAHGSSRGRLDDDVLARASQPGPGVCPPRQGPAAAPSPAYQRAIECNSGEPRLFLELDQLLEAEGVAARASCAAGTRTRLSSGSAMTPCFARSACTCSWANTTAPSNCWTAATSTSGKAASTRFTTCTWTPTCSRGRGSSPPGDTARPWRSSCWRANIPTASRSASPMTAAGPHRSGTTSAPLMKRWARPTRPTPPLSVPSVRQGRERTCPTTRDWHGAGSARRPRLSPASMELIRLGGEMLAGTGEDFFEKFGVRRAASVHQAQAHYLWGCGALGRGDAAAAGKEFERAIELNANHLWARNGLAVLGSGGVGG